MINIIKHSKSPPVWRQLIGDDRQLWTDAFKQLKDDFQKNTTALQRAYLRMQWCTIHRHALIKEVYSLAAYCRVDPWIVILAQVFYDEGWSIEEHAPGHGCTSVSTDKYFGRNLDYCYPDNASELVFHRDIHVNGVDMHVEGFAGLLGWLAFRSELASAAFNQAPCLRPIARSRIPSLWWFRNNSIRLASGFYSDIPRFGNEWIPEPTASDFLLHFVIGKHRYLAEVHDQQIVWQKMKGKTVQANIYQLIDIKASRDWTADSLERMQLARQGRGLHSSLEAASHIGTIDSITL